MEFVITVSIIQHVAGKIYSGACAPRGPAMAWNIRGWQVGVGLLSSPAAAFEYKALSSDYRAVLICEPRRYQLGKLPQGLPGGIESG